MLRNLTTPIMYPVAALLAGLAAVALLLSLALAQPWLGLSLTPEEDQPGLAVASVIRGGPADRAGLVPGQRILALDGITLAPDDVIEEPDMLPDFAAWQGFLANQARLAAALRSPGAVVLTLEGGETLPLLPGPGRPVWSLAPEFWIQVLVGLFGLCAGAWVLGARRGPAEASLLLAGVGLMLSAGAAAIYSTRELALAGDLFRTLSGINHLGALLFGVAMIWLFLLYPVRLVARIWLVVPAVILLGWWGLNQAGFIVDSSTGFQLPVILALLTIGVCVALQHRATRNDPRARAALRWFGLSVLIGAGAFVVTIIVPVLLGMPAAMSQGLAFLFFLPIYGGLALGVARYRLFELEEWAFSILFYIGGMAVLVALDALLILLVAMDRAPAFGLSLMAVAMVYLPMRDRLARRLLGVREAGAGSLFRAVTDVALTPTGAQRLTRWQALLTAEFRPARIETADPAPARPQLVEDGAVLELPVVDDLPAQRLVWARYGRALFAPRDLARATDLVTMLSEAAASRRAYETGVAEERARIAQDMHDNIGIQLMGALHSPSVLRKDALIRETMSDLRDIISNANRADLSLDELLADLRATLGEHLSAAGITLDWQQAGTGPAALTPRTAHALRSILREAVGNALRHSGARQVTVRLDTADDQLRLLVGDDGCGFGESTPGSGGGHGLGNMRARAGGLGGSIHFGPGVAGGTRVEALLPLYEEARQG